MKFSKTHEWVEIVGNTATVGITDYAQKEMGDIVYAELPEIGGEIIAGEGACELESVKAVAPVNSPVSGCVTEVNGDLEDDPAAINRDCYAAWLFKSEISEEGDDLMDEAAYKEYIKTL